MCVWVWQKNYSETKHSIHKYLQRMQLISANVNNIANKSNEPKCNAFKFVLFVMSWQFWCKIQQNWCKFCAMNIELTQLISLLSFSLCDISILYFFLLFYFSLSVHLFISIILRIKNQLPFQYRIRICVSHYNNRTISIWFNKIVSFFLNWSISFLWLLQSMVILTDFWMRIDI